MKQGVQGINPQLVAALKEINDDPGYLGNGELVDLSVCKSIQYLIHQRYPIRDGIRSVFSDAAP